MKRLRVSDIEALLGPEAAARLVEGVKEIRGRQTYVVEVDAVFKTRELVEAKSAAEARQIAEKRVDVTWESNPSPTEEPVRPTLKSRVIVQERIDAKGVPVSVPETAKGPGSTPRPKRQPRPSRD